MTKVGDTWKGTKLCTNLVDLRDVSFVDSNASAQTAAQYRDHVAGQTIVTCSRISSYFAYLFLKFSKPKVSTWLFTKEDEAIIWLKAQMSARKN